MILVFFIYLNKKLGYNVFDKLSLQTLNELRENPENKLITHPGVYL